MVERPATTSARMTVWIASARTSQFTSRSASSTSRDREIAFSPRRRLSRASSEWPNATPMLRCVVESVRSRCMREVTSVCDSEFSRLPAISRFASAFSKRIGLILCGIVDEPVAPATGICAKYPSEM
ncbi:hypothetical protein D3C73_1403330 [compost metagenome]